MQYTQAKLSESVLFQGVIESFVDGIMILTKQGNLVRANNLARQICDRLTQGKPQRNPVPAEIWRICQSLIESRDSYCDRSAIIESEIASDRAIPVRIRVQWLQLATIPHPCLLVILEDQHQSIHNLTISEVERYGLTAREAEVWLLRRANYTCKEIAAELYISLNTVKKHLKNIHAKRETALYKQAWRAEFPH